MTDQGAGKLAAVTGATGFLGRQIVRALETQGWRVRALVRHAPIEAWNDPPPEIVSGGLADESALGRLCAGADVVIHCAGLMKARSRTEFDAVNVAGARRVAAAARDAGVGHVVLVSSLAAREPSLSHYSASKAAGEVAMREVLGAALTIARPCAIYGPGDRELLAVFQTAAASPVLPLLSEPARVTMIHVADAADQVAALAATQRNGGSVVALCDSRPDGYSWRELMA